MVLFILLFMVRVITAASFRFGNVGVILAKPAAEVNRGFAKNIIISHNTALYGLCNMHKFAPVPRNARTSRGWKLFSSSQQHATGFSSLSRRAVLL